MPNPKPITPRMKRLYHELVAHRWGEPSGSRIYDGTVDPPTALDTLHVLWWDPEDGCEVTTFFTLGLSERLLPKTSHRAELTLGIRASLDQASRNRLAALIANLAEYPFMYDRALGWWERLVNPGDIPCFPKCSQLLLAPMLGDEPFDRFPSPDEDVGILSVIPITEKEGHILRSGGRSAFLDYWEESGVDLFSPRSDTSRAPPTA